MYCFDLSLALVFELRIACGVLGLNFKVDLKDNDLA